MKLKLYGFVFILLGISTSCNNDDDVQPDIAGEATVSFSFMPYYDGAELGISDRFTNVNGYPVEVTDMTFYLSNIKLHSGSDTTFLSDIEIVNVRDLNLGFSFTVPAGDFDAVSFDLGVPQDLNGTANPDFLTSIYSPDHPLSESNGMYWVWQTGYRFFSFEGRYDVVDNPDNLPLSYALHSGRDTLFREMAPFPVAVQAAVGTAVNLNFAVDVDKIFSNDGDTIDLQTENNFHGSLSQLDLGIKFANNSAAAFRLLP